jgi:ATP-dependent DNA helicase RecQ
MCPPAARRDLPAMRPEPGGVDPDAVLRRHFGYPGFRPGQRELVDAALEGRDALGILPTGGGKSVCYQVPALIVDGLTIVVSPLVSLMADQVRRAEEAGLSAEALHSGRSPAEIERAERDLAGGRVRLLFLAPERFGSARFERLLPRLRPSLMTIDEAHCISMWGNDFRPSYGRLGAVRSRLGTPVLALTATATPRVQREIVSSLGMRKPLRVVGSFDRPNLLWAVRGVRSTSERNREIRALLLRFRGARLVYAATRGRVERVRNTLARRGIRAEAYHAGLSPEERTRVQEHFLSAESPVVVATNAFGMGIDRPDVRLVVHDQLPGSIEDYYQEAGRAGRDGDPALCAALYMRGDRRLHRAFLDRTHPPVTRRRRASSGQEEPPRDVRSRLRLRRAGKAKLQGVHRYALSSACRRRVMLEWFGETSDGPGCAGCDRCSSWSGLLERVARL